MNLLFELSGETGSRLNWSSPIRISALASHRKMIHLYEGVAPCRTRNSLQSPLSLTTVMATNELLC
jgi:hypothetical protein